MPDSQRQQSTAGESIEAGWIECPDCGGSGGWFGCYDCGASVAGDATEFEERGKPAYCRPCQRIKDCAADGGHNFGPIRALDRERRQPQRFERECACGAVQIVAEAHWTIDGYVEPKDLHRHLDNA